MTLITKKELLIRGKRFKIPGFVPSVSGASNSISTISKIEVLLDAIKQSKTNTIMISNYDLIRNNGIFELYFKKANTDRIDIRSSLKFDKNSIVFLDSGGYELQKVGTRLRDWDNPSQVFLQQTKMRPDVMVILDKHPQLGESQQEKKQIVEENIKVVKNIIKTRSIRIPLMAIAHGYDENSLYETVKEFSKLKDLEFVAISDKEFNDFLDLDKIRLLFKSKKIMNGEDNTKSLHLLAAGDISLWPFYTATGVNSFDSTSWIDKIVDTNSKHWLDITSKDPIDCQCKKCMEKNPKISNFNDDENLRLVHNLLCINKINSEIRDNLIKGDLHKLSENYFPELYQQIIQSDLKKIFENSEAT